MTLPDVRRGLLRRRDGEPVFGEPWQAQTLAMADLLIRSAVISDAEWTETLGAEIRAAEAAGKPDDTKTYFDAALSALEGLLVKTGRLTRAEVTERRDDWDRAFRRTPHGQPVALDQAALRFHHRRATSVQ